MVRDLYRVTDQSIADEMERGRLPLHFSGGDHKRFWMLIMFLRRGQPQMRKLFTRAVAHHPGGEAAVRAWFDGRHFREAECELPVDVWVSGNWTWLAQKLRSRRLEAYSKREVAERARQLADDYGVSPSVFDSLLYYAW